eukprot:COSAG02_NODE_7016_length_3226_cov_23.259034_6_plen_69_part_00
MREGASALSESSASHPGLLGAKGPAPSAYSESSASSQPPSAPPDESVEFSSAVDSENFGVHMFVSEPW